MQGELRVHAKNQHEYEHQRQHQQRERRGPGRQNNTPASATIRWHSTLYHSIAYVYLVRVSVRGEVDGYNERSDSRSDGRHSSFARAYELE